jgi:hypothetical protein
MKKMVRVNRRREVRIHAELWHTSNCLLENALKIPDGKAHQFRASLIFRAFALEGFLNWLGPKLIPHWEYLDRLKPQEKLALLAALVNVTPDYGSRPWQILKELFRFRNALAHGKPEDLEDETEQELEEYLSKIDFVVAEWEAFASEANALRAQQDVRLIAKTLYDAARVKHEGPIGPFVFGSQIRKASL